VDYWVYAIVIGGVAVSSLILFIASRVGKGNEKDSSEDVLENKGGLRLDMEPSVASWEIGKARDKLRTLNLEREILSHAIRRIHEAEVAGEINERERERLTYMYNERMEKIKDTISRNGSIVALHELETTKEDLVKLFDERFDDLNKKIEELRSRLYVKPPVEVSVTSPIPTLTAPKKRRRRRPQPLQKTEAEERIEKIKQDVEKVLERLGQVEMEEES
jgi:hypothetical protein